MTGRITLCLAGALLFTAAPLAAHELMAVRDQNPLIRGLYLPVAGEVVAAVGLSEPSPRLAGDWVDAVVAAEPGESQTASAPTVVRVLSASDTDAGGRWRRIAAEEEWTPPAKEVSDAEGHAHASDSALEDILAEEDLLALRRQGDA